MKKLLNNSILRNAAILGIAIAVVLVTYAVQFSVFAARGQENKYNPTKSLDSLIGQYHDTLNKLFNKNIAIMVSGENKNNISISTYSLAKAATDEYFEFREALIQKRDILKTQIEEIAPSSARKQNKRFNRASEIPRLDEEIEIARQTLDQTLSAYNELQMALPMHRKYKEIIKALENYRDVISKIRREVDLYPAAFIDVTTTQCT